MSKDVSHETPDVAPCRTSPPMPLFGDPCAARRTGAERRPWPPSSPGWAKIISFPCCGVGVSSGGGVIVGVVCRTPGIAQPATATPPGITQSPVPAPSAPDLVRVVIRTRALCHPEGPATKGRPTRGRRVPGAASAAGSESAAVPKGVCSSELCK